MVFELFRRCFGSLKYVKFMIFADIGVKNLEISKFFVILQVEKNNAEVSRTPIYQRLFG